MLIWPLASFGQGSTRDPRPLFSVDFGFGGKRIAEEWGPIRVSITGGSRSVQGYVVAEYVQDATQTARVAVPFAVSASATMQVELLANMPEMCQRMEIALKDESGRRLRSLTYSMSPSADEMALPGCYARNEALVVGVGRVSVAVASGRMAAKGAGDTQAVRRNEPPEESAWRQVAAVRLDPASMPRSWVGYEGVDALVVDADAADRADPRSVRAVREWVDSGGHLVILADGPASKWREWLPEGPEGDLVEVLEPAALATPYDLRLALAQRVGSRDVSVIEDGALDAQAAPLDAPPVPRDEMTGRLIALTDRAVHQGWATRWRPGPQRDVGLIAEGPVGLGWATVLGADPQNTLIEASASAMGVAWRSALEGSLRTWIAHAREVLRSDQGWDNWWSAGVVEREALASTLDRTARVVGVGDEGFVVVCALMLAVGALVGPVDRIVLRRLGMSQRSWATALVWIGACSLLAFIAPRFMRSAAWHTNRVTVLDRIVGPDSSPVGMATMRGVTGFFAGSSGIVRLTAADEQSWWCGVSAREQWQGTAAGTAVVSTSQRPPSLADFSGGNPLESLSMGLWTFRTFADRARVRSLLTARVRRQDEGWSVLVAGLEQGTTVASAACQIKGGWVLLEEVEADDHSWSGWGQPHKEPPAEWKPIESSEIPESWGWGWMGSAPERTFRPGKALDMEMVSGQQSRATRLATGKWAVVHLFLDGLPMDAKVDRPAAGERSGVVRLIVPLEEDDWIGALRTSPIDEGSSP